MKLNKKATALLLGLTLGISGTAFAADGADSFSDVPQGHWAYDALDYLAKDGVIDGMGDGTFQGNRTMTRYEMASIVAKAMQKGNLGVGDQAVLEKLEKEYGSELATLSKQVNANTKAIKDLNAKTDKFKVWGMTRVQMGKDTGLAKYTSAESDLAGDFNSGKNGDYNNRFYMDLEGQMKINDHAVARFTVEKNARYRDSEARRYVRVTGNGTAKGNVAAILPAASHQGQDSFDYDQTHNGSVSNIWVELQLGKNHNWYTNIGRKWNGVGMQNLMLGGVVDGIQTYHPIEKGHGWWFSAQYYQGASNWHEEGTVNQDALQNAFDKVNFQSVDAYNDSLVASWKTSSGLTYTGAKAKDAYSYDANLKQMVADQTKLQAARAAQKTWANNNGFGDQYWAQAKTPVSDFSKLDATTQADLLAKNTKYTAGRSPVLGLVNFWGPIGKYIDANVAYSRVLHNKDNFYLGADSAWGFDLKVKPFKDFSVTTSFVKTNSKVTYLNSQSGWNRDLAVRADYRGTDLNKVGSWGLWVKWQQMGAAGDFGHDDEWSTREPTYTNGTKGWLCGFNLVPWKNVEWGTLYGRMNEAYGLDWGSYMGTPQNYKRTILRTWLDFHF